MIESSEHCTSCGNALDVSALQPLSDLKCPRCGSINRVLRNFDHFRLVKVIGQGGAGTVYQAFDTKLQRTAALKFLRADFAQDKEFIEKLVEEAAVTASINHPHVVKVFSTGTAHGMFYLAMELIERGTLADQIDSQQRLSETQTLALAVQVAQGLRAAAEHGLIHRDIKPGNILLTSQGTAKIVDFGLAASLEVAKHSSSEIWGTPYYLPPERLNGVAEDFRSDMYSLGATLFHALAGRPPFEAKDANLVALKHLQSQVVGIQSFAPHVSGETAFVINRMLGKSPDQRYQSYDELIEHLEYARTAVTEKARQPTPGRARIVLETNEEQKLW
ncbi:MAG: protein kinase, partial [Verrucomicrobiota bacterium]